LASRKKKKRKKEKKRVTINGYDNDNFFLRVYDVFGLSSKK
jgi:hypothetical protein